MWIHGENGTGDGGLWVGGRTASRARRTWRSLTLGINQLRSKSGHQIICWKSAFLLAHTVSTRGAWLFPTCWTCSRTSSLRIDQHFKKHLNIEDAFIWFFLEGVDAFIWKHVLSGLSGGSYQEPQRLENYCIYSKKEQSIQSKHCLTGTVWEM